MRRWPLTTFLFGTAALAILVAPRLMAAVTVQPQVVVAVPPPAPIAVVLEAPPQPPVVHTPPPPRHVVRPRVPSPPKPVRTRRAARDPLIPELDEPNSLSIPSLDVVVRPTPAPPEVPDSFWDNCPACGMG